MHFLQKRVTFLDEMGRVDGWLSPPHGSDLQKRGAFVFLLVLVFPIVCFSSFNLIFVPPMSNDPPPCLTTPATLVGGQTLQVVGHGGQSNSQTKLA